ncbi:MAG: hypothetical protein KGL39_31020, partial [Patescibacteria group bacterium]|nr:hypothetical protein [Patescibacteria group bacterium]
MSELRFWSCEDCGREAPYVPGDIQCHQSRRIRRNRKGRQWPEEWPCEKCGGDMLLWEMTPLEFAGG